MGLFGTLSTGYLIESVGKAVGHVASGLNSRADAKGLQSMPAPDIHVEVEAGRGGEVRALTCPSCNANLEVAPGRPIAYCCYCGAQLHYDDGSVNVTYRAVDETRLREAEMKSMVKLKKLELEEKRRPGRIKASIALAILGFGMMVVGQVAGSASGDSGSGWYMLEMLGMFPLLAIVAVWTMGKDRENDDD